MTDIPRAASREEISKWVEDAASAEPSYRYPAGSAGEERDFHAERIEACLVRARRKTFVKMLKPFRGMFRNQGAVNDSLIEAVQHLAAQNEEIIERMNELQALVGNLRNQIRRTTRGETVSEIGIGHSAGTTQLSTDKPDPSHPAAPDRTA